MPLFRNRFEMIGRIGLAELREVGDRRVLVLRIAQDQRPREGEQPGTDWFTVEMWGNGDPERFEALAKRFEVGREVYLAGEIRPREWERTVETEDGSEATIQQRDLRLVVREYRLLGRSRRAQNNARPVASSTSPNGRNGRPVTAAPSAGRSPARRSGR